MAPKKQVFILLLSLFTVSLIIKSSHAVDCPPYAGGGNISVYWGQNSDANEGSLTEACDTGHYNILILAYLHVYGSTTSLNLGNHCPSGDCTKLESEIKHCQSKGIQVLLSIEVDSSQLDPTFIAKYLLDNFLSGNAGPLGSVALDGIDLANFGYSASIPWDELVRAINASTHDRKIYQSAAPRCDDKGLDAAIATGFFDYIWVLYYNNYASCEYLNGNPENLLNSWENWTSSVPPNSSVFLGVVASSESSAASSGYIPPDVLKSAILPTVKEASNFGGVMIWNAYYDKKTDYSGQIKDALSSKVCECVCHEPVSGSFYGLLSQSL